MQTVRALTALGLITFSIAACARPAAPPTGAQPNTPTVSATAPVNSAQPSAQTTVPTGNRVAGTVEEVMGGEVHMQDGEAFSVGQDTIVIRSAPVDAQTLAPGEFVAVTAQRQPDGTLLASVVNIFPEAMRGLGEGQRPMAGGNLMTNATVDQLGPNLMTNATIEAGAAQQFTVAFPGGSDVVRLADDAQVNQFTAAGPDDLVPGTRISALVDAGEARFITITAG